MIYRFIFLLLLLPGISLSTNIHEKLRKERSNDDFNLNIHGGSHFSTYYVYQEQYYKHGSGEEFTGRLMKNNKLLNSDESPSGATGTGMLYDGGLLGDYRNDMDFSNIASLVVNAKRRLNSDTLYGANMEFSLATSAARTLKTNSAYIFLESAYGKIEMGSNKGAAESFRIDATSISTVGGEISNEWHCYANLEGYYKDASFVPGNTTQNTRHFSAQHPFHVIPALYTEYTRAGPGYKRLKNDVVGIYAPKITYYSHNHSGLMFGISYTADETSVWNGDKSDKRDYQNVLSSGISYESEFDNLKFKLAFTGETGDFKKRKENNVEEYFDLLGWNVGVKVTYAGFKFASSHGNLNKSGIAKRYSSSNLNEAEDPFINANPGNTTYWTVGWAYEIGPAMAGISYFNSSTCHHENMKNNALSNTAIGLHYHLGGKKYKFTPYIAWNYFTTNEYDATTLGGKSNAGSVSLAGVKVTF